MLTDDLVGNGAKISTIIQDSPQDRKEKWPVEETIETEQCEAPVDEEHITQFHLNQTSRIPEDEGSVS